MEPVVAIIAPGAMGAAVAQRLAGHGVQVLTSLAGRSAASAERARAAGMRPVEEAALAEAGILLSIVPPGEAMALAERLAPVLARKGTKGPLYADCNAVSPRTAMRIGEAVSAAGLRFVDAGIIGGPPKPGGARGPTFYASGPHAAGLMALAERGLSVEVLDGPVGAASGLKMSYAGITKGTTALASAMALAAGHFGAAADLRRELARSRPDLLAFFDRTVPDMFPKAYRWVAEMEEIAEFAGEGDPAARRIYEGIARLYERLAEDGDGGKEEIGRLAAFFRR
jgi:L-threonate 2-dehydrogenase